MKILRNTARILLGITFVFSGFVKGVDPLGTTYKIVDYFTAFGTGWANSLAFSFSVLQSIAEFGIGAALLFNYRMKISSWLALIFMALFTPLTL
ncbi:MAG TPA: MauE/DoxX family redox-associated membrane protein, partial [Prolixibacteraceae bacterium]|nr:MauE/DoxX family redox-associated membrane protein [Prolixibacteraceae bacterium]